MKLIDEYVPFLEILNYEVESERGKIKFKTKEKKYIIAYDKFLTKEECDVLIIIGFNSPNLKNATLFNLKKLTVSGKSDRECERFRNHLRRHGIVFDFDNYQADNYASKYWCVFE